MTRALGDISNVNVVPVNVFWGKRSVLSVVCPADVSDSLDGKYFEFSAYTHEYVLKNFYVWFNTSGGSAVDPALLNKTGIVVAITTGDTASTVATAVAAAINAKDEIRSASAVSATVSIYPEHFGLLTAPTAGNSTGFTFALVTAGLGGSLGLCSDGVELSSKTDWANIEADGFGKQLIGKILVGVSGELSLTIEEFTTGNISALIGNVAGAELTPGGGTKVIGMGTSKNFSNMFQYAQELILQPVNNADLSGNYYIWKAFPELDKIPFKGGDIQKVAVKFSIFEDTSKDSKISLWCRGDGTQDLSA